MKLLCIADHIDPFIYSAGLKTRFADVDLVLSAGDLSLDYYDFIVSILNKPLYFVFGNHHLEGSSPLPAARPIRSSAPRRAGRRAVGATYLQGRVVRAKGLIIAGLGGSIWYNGGENQFTDFGMFLCHPAPPAAPAVEPGRAGQVPGHPGDPFAALRDQ